MIDENLASDAEQEQDQDEGQRCPQEPEQDVDHRVSPHARPCWRCGLFEYFRLMLSPEPIQPPTTAPTSPRKIAVRAHRAESRAASAAAALSTTGGACDAQAGGAASPPYHAPR